MRPSCRALRSVGALQTGRQQACSEATSSGSYRLSRTRAGPNIRSAAERPRARAEAAGVIASEPGIVAIDSTQIGSGVVVVGWVSGGQLAGRARPPTAHHPHQGATRSWYSPDRSAPGQVGPRTSRWRRCELLYCGRG